MCLCCCHSKAGGCTLNHVLPSSHAEALVFSISHAFLSLRTSAESNVGFPSFVRPSLLLLTPTVRLAHSRGEQTTLYEPPATFIPLCNNYLLINI